ncbi:glycosyltransferase [Desulfosporosinus sp. OT]|uniref:glycosyltransferase family 2 protein n=1 Tax=Desulfosporosinus sp. OT TaxID=913865 RepID=UPI000223A574|nr:glycosyltransferase [Desulfosporosinus sp. OT]EGW41274.1 glycosyl transferase 2 family protein [Desulfosporosinus sp. OT]
MRKARVMRGYEYMTKLSIIVPVYNVQDYIARCLESLIMQTLDNIEIIVVNDGSKDNSEEIIEKYLQKCPEKFVYLKKPNGGLSDARNYGMRYATGEYIAFLDSDDYVELEMYEKMYKRAVESESYIVECNFWWDYPRKRKIDYRDGYIDIKDYLLRGRVTSWNKIYKRTWIQELNISFPLGLRYEDLDFFYKIVPSLPSIDKVSVIKEPYLHYIQRPGSIANSQNEKVGHIHDVLDDIISFYKKENLYDEYADVIEYEYTRVLLCSFLFKMLKIKDRRIRRNLIRKTWKNINTYFPSWRKNKYLIKGNSVQDYYLKLVNGVYVKLLLLT